MDLSSLGLNKLDYILLIFIALFCLLGFMKGAIRQFFSILAFILASAVSVAVPYFVSLPLGEMVSPLIGNMILAVLVWIPAYLIFNCIAKYISSKMLRDGVKLGDRIWGVIFGGIKGFLIVVLVVFIIEPFSGALDGILPAVPAALAGSRVVQAVGKHNPLSRFRILQNLQTVLIAVNDPDTLALMEEDSQFQELIEQESIQAVLNDPELKEILVQKQYIKFIANPQVQKLLTDKEALRLLANVQVEEIEEEEEIDIAN